MLLMVTNVSTILPLYKNGEPANAIEAIRVGDFDFDTVVQKNRFVVGTPCIFVMPDTKLEENEVWAEYITPSVGSSKLGKGNRVRAIKFNLSLDANTDEPTYSQGIVISIDELPEQYKSLVQQELQGEANPEKIAEILGVSKYVSQVDVSSAGNPLAKGDFPSFLKISDEPNFLTMRRYFVDGDEYIVTVKKDGQSVTIYTYFDGEKQVTGVCSRRQELELEPKELKGFQDQEGNKLTKYFDRETKQRGWMHPTLGFIVEGDARLGTEFLPIYVQVTNPIVEAAKRQFPTLFETNTPTLNGEAIRAEYCGQGIQNKKGNPDAQGEPSLWVYGLDTIQTLKDDSGKLQPIGSLRVPQAAALETAKKLFSAQCVPFVNQGKFTYDEMLTWCQEYFKNSETVIEGVVIRSANGNFSAKYINPAYDSKV